jgi:hypothetical protein
MSENKKSKTAAAAVASGTRFTIRLPDDFHHHCRDGPKTACVLEHATKRFGRCLMMPNLNPPVTTTELALKYKKHIQDSMPKGSFPNFQPLMVLYLTDKTTPEEIARASQNGIVGCKYYPAGATTNSDFGVTDIKNCYAALKEMDKLNMMLCIHSEVTHADIFEREPVFIEEVIKPLVVDFPKLKITMEHISTKQAVEYVLSAPENIKASITCHHLLFNRNREYLLKLLYEIMISTRQLFLNDFFLFRRLVGGRNSSSFVLFANSKGRSAPSSLARGRNFRKQSLLFGYRFSSALYRHQGIRVWLCRDLYGACCH